MTLHILELKIDRENFRPNFQEQKKNRVKCKKYIVPNDIQFLYLYNLFLYMDKRDKVREEYFMHILSNLFGALFSTKLSSVLHCQIIKPCYVFGFNLVLVNLVNKL